MPTRDRKLHVVLETERKPPTPAATAILQNRVRTCARQSRRQQTALSQLAVQIAGALSGGRGSPDASRPQPPPPQAPQSLNTLTQTARRLVAASEVAAGVQEAAQRKNEVARQLDVNEQQQREVVRSIQNERLRLAQLTQLFRRRLQTAQVLGTGVDSVMQTYNQTLAHKQAQVGQLRQNLQALRQEQIDLNSKFDQMRRDQEAYETAVREQENAARQLQLTPQPPAVPAPPPRRRRRRRPQLRRVQPQPQPQPRPQRRRR